MKRRPLNSILIKPAGPDCNMACAYCFYLEKAGLFAAGEQHRMSEEILEAMVRQAMKHAPGQISFGWQGGEPTLMGLPFFEKAVELQKKHGRSHTVGNGLQTNGILINEEWARFLAEYNVLVGLSIDGPAHVHDRYRKMKGGRGSWDRVVDRARLMLDEGVAVNALTVVNDYAVVFAEEIYTFHKELGLNYMQFIPLVDTGIGSGGDDVPDRVTAERFGAFLCTLFDLWIDDFDNGVPTTSVRFFDSVFHVYAGLQPPECTLLSECGAYVVVEHNGDVYSCDFYVEPEWRLGNVLHDELGDLLNCERQNEFGLMKSRLAKACQNCRWLKYCRGGCTRDRVAGAQGDLSHLCESFQIFFRHADEPLQELARKWKREQIEAREAELDRIRRSAESGGRKVGRNDPCPCGSGRKFKVCCGRA